MSKQLLDMFYEYVHMFDMQDEKIALKVSHTIRVANTARQLAEKMIYPKQVQPICENNDNPRTRPQT